MGDRTYSYSELIAAREYVLSVIRTTKAKTLMPIYHRLEQEIARRTNDDTLFADILASRV